jgi:hypothetical protein
MPIITAYQFIKELKKIGCFTTSSRTKYEVIRDDNGNELSREFFIEMNGPLKGFSLVRRVHCMKYKDNKYVDFTFIDSNNKLLYCYNAWEKRFIKIDDLSDRCIHSFTQPDLKEIWFPMLKYIKYIVKNIKKN